MAEEKVTGKRYTCDGCGATQIILKDDQEPPLGITLSGHFDLGTGGGPIQKAFACSIECVQEAVKEAMYR